MLVGIQARRRLLIHHRYFVQYPDGHMETFSLEENLPEIPEAVADKVEIINLLPGLWIAELGEYRGPSEQALRTEPRFFSNHIHAKIDFAPHPNGDAFTAPKRLKAHGETYMDALERAHYEAMKFGGNALISVDSRQSKFHWVPMNKRQFLIDFVPILEVSSANSDGYSIGFMLTDAQFSVDVANVM